jgi:peptidoglycan/LPS O-acetylase OafA/YrhL
MNEKSGRLLELDCLRGIAAMFVVIFHFTLGQKIPYKHILMCGSTGVDLFFMISGFVIFLTIEKTSDYRKFLISRFARLYPAYWVCLTLTTLSIIGWSIIVKAPYTFPTLKDYLINLTMFQYYFGVKNIDNVYWTLTIELSFYLFILLIYLVKKLHNIELIGFFILLCCLVYSFPRYFTFTNYNLFAYLPILSYFPLFIAGIGFYKIKFHGVSIYRCLLLLVCFITQILLFDRTGKIFVITHTQYIGMLVLYFSFFILYSFNLLSFIINKFTLFTGRISYSLYLIHNFIATSLLIPLFTNSRHFHFNIFVTDWCIVLPIVLIIASLVNKYVEVPAMDYLKGKRKLKG